MVCSNGSDKFSDKTDRLAALAGLDLSPREWKFKLRVKLEPILKPKRFGILISAPS